MRSSLYKSRIVLAALLPWLLAGCLVWGNGEGIGRKPSTTKPVGLLPGSYYDLDPAAVCTSSAGDTIYRWRIDYADSVTRTDRCSGATETIADIRTAPLWSLIVYHGSIYEFRTSSPLPGERYVQAYCSGSKVEGLVVNGPALSVPYGYASWPSDLRQGDLSVSNGGSIHTFDATRFELRIDTATAGSAVGEFAGTLDRKDGTNTVPLSCAYRP